MVYEFNGSKPTFDGNKIFVAQSADVIGQVYLAEDVSIWFNVTLRGDLEPITIGRCSNVQDGSTVHTDTGFPVVIGENVTVGHNCVIHGCEIGVGSLVGMGAVILTGAKIGPNCLIGAGSLVTGRMEIPAGMLVLGSPAKVIKRLDEEAAAKCLKNTQDYVKRKNQYLNQGMGRGCGRL